MKHSDIENEFLIIAVGDLTHKHTGILDEFTGKKGSLCLKTQEDVENCLNAALLSGIGFMLLHKIISSYKKMEGRKECLEEIEGNIFQLKSVLEHLNAVKEHESKQKAECN